MENNEYLKIGSFELTGWKASIAMNLIIIAWTALAFAAGAIYTAQPAVGL